MFDERGTEGNDPESKNWAENKDDEKWNSETEG